MLERFQLLRNIGQFDSVDAGADIPLARYVLIYAENGRGKTTLAAILRSLATGNPVPLMERRRLAAEHPPHVVLRCSDGIIPQFRDGNWSIHVPEIVIFDDRFVDENLYSGLNVGTEHRQNLHELVLGAEGVALNRRLKELVVEIENHITDVRNRAAAIQPAIGERISVDDFCALPVVPGIDDEIQTAERNLAAAREQFAVQRTVEFEVLSLPRIDLDGVAQILELDLPLLEAVAGARVQAHFGRIGRNAEAWVADGMTRVVRGRDGRDICPFCAQDLAASPLITHYRAYFSDEYSRLKRRIAEALDEAERVDGEGVPATFERAVRLQAERLYFWSRFCDVPEIALDTRELARRWTLARLGVIELLRSKQAAPLERMIVPEDVRDAIEHFEHDRATVDVLSERLQLTNVAIRAVKERVAGVNPAEMERRLATLRATRTRHTREVGELCTAYLESQAAKARSEQLRDEARLAIERYRAGAFPACQLGTNTYLERFGAGYRLERISPVDTRGGAACNYDVLINDTPVPVSGGVPAPGQPSFRNTLSSGDRTTLALAFFFATLDQDRNLAGKIVVIDDPITSLDEHRTLTTVQRLRLLGQQVSQVIILSHSKSLLCQIWQGIDQTNCAALRLERHGNSSTVASWDVSTDSLTEYDKRHAKLRSYLADGPRGDSLEVATSLRPLLEGFLRIARPEHCPPVPRVLAIFLRACEASHGTANEILNLQNTRELSELVEYANRFHHDNPAWAPQGLNDAELAVFIRRVLRFACR
jgi:wobble nucleotide-excising tRNase